MLPSHPTRVLPSAEPRLRGLRVSATSTSNVVQARRVGSAACRRTRRLFARHRRCADVDGSSLRTTRVAGWSRQTEARSREQAPPPQGQALGHFDRFILVKMQLEPTSAAAVVDAAAEAFGEDFARGRSKVKFRGTVVERGTTDGHDSGRPALSEEEVGDGPSGACATTTTASSGRRPSGSPSLKRARSGRIRGRRPRKISCGGSSRSRRQPEPRSPTAWRTGAVDQHWKIMEGQGGESVTVPRRLCDHWTAAEERRLREMVAAAGHPATRLGAKGWADITARLGTQRSPSAVERHWQNMTEIPGQDRRRRREADDDDDEWVEGAAAQEAPRRTRGGARRRPTPRSRGASRPRRRMRGRARARAEEEVATLDARRGAAPARPRRGVRR